MKHKGNVLDQKNNFSIIDCIQCGFIHINPIPTKEDLNSIYTEDYYTEEKPLYIERNLEDKKWWETVYEDRLNLIKKFKKSKGKRLLELGSGPGLFLKYATENGWDTLGIEPSKKAATFSQKSGLSVINSFYQDVELDKLGQFDAVVMFEFLEHVIDPQEVIKFSYKFLNSGGVICIGVPNDYNPLQKVVVQSQKAEPYWVAPPFHINYFTPKSLKNLLQKNEFDVQLCQTSFPLEMFILMGENYVGDDTVGRKIHQKRKEFDIALYQCDNQVKLALYEKLAEIGLGRDLTIFASKH